MADALNVNVVVIPLSAADWEGDDVDQHILRAPEADEGGGITLLRAYAVNEATTSPGTAFGLALYNYGTGGTAIKAVGGTVAAPIGGANDGFVAGKPKQFVLSNAYLAPGEWLVLRKTEDDSSDPTRGSVVLHYLMGR